VTHAERISKRKRYCEDKMACYIEATVFFRNTDNNKIHGTCKRHAKSYRNRFFKELTDDEIKLLEIIES
jgi:hypothetical protein